MKCPFCGHLGDKVVDSRESKEGEAIRRRRECLECGRRFTSYERIDEIAYMVIKKDGTRERKDLLAAKDCARGADAAAQDGARRSASRTSRHAPGTGSASAPTRGRSQ